MLRGLTTVNYLGVRRGGRTGLVRQAARHRAVLRASRRRLTGWILGVMFNQHYLEILGSFA
jgi:hypothetical protein